MSLIEDFSATPGMVKAMTGGYVYLICACGMPIPRYVGAYPKTCPNCGNPLKKDSDTPGAADTGDQTDMSADDAGASRFTADLD